MFGVVYSSWARVTPRTRPPPYASAGPPHISITNPHPSASVFQFRNFRGMGPICGSHLPGIAYIPESRFLYRNSILYSNCRSSIICMMNNQQGSAMSFDRVQKPEKRATRPNSPRPDVGAGVREFGKAKKPTGYIAFTRRFAETAFGPDYAVAHLQLFIGSGANAGQIELRVTENPADADVRMRGGFDAKEVMVQSVLIPLPSGAKTIQKAACGFARLPDNGGVRVELPWELSADEDGL